MRVFIDSWFCRFTKQEKISDSALKNAISRAEKGSVDADLGGGVIKQRIARPGQGKSGGYRSVILFRKGELAFFVYGYAKSDRENIDTDDLAGFRKLAKAYLSLSAIEIETLLKSEKLREVL